MTWTGVLLNTHLLFKDSKQKKGLITCFDFQLPKAVESKLSELCSCLLIYFHQLICVTETKSQCSGNFSFQNQKVKMIDCGQGLWTGTTQCTLIIKCWIMNPLILITTCNCFPAWIPRNLRVRNLLIYRHSLHRDFRSWRFPLGKLTNKQSHRNSWHP